MIKQAIANIYPSWLMTKGNEIIPAPTVVLMTRVILRKILAFYYGTNVETILFC